MEFPSYPNFSPLDSAGRDKLWGKFTYEAKPIDGNPENIVVDPKWVAENIIVVTIPQLIGIPGASKSGKVQFHKRAADQLIELFQMWQNDGLMDRVLTWGGTYCPRFIRGSKTVLSNHSVGSAFDLNVQWNLLGKEPAKFGQKGCVWELVPAAHTCGAIWGGHFKSRPDGMHFSFDVDLNL